MKKLLPAILAILVVVLAVPLLSQLRGSGLTLGREAPDFTLGYLNSGGGVSLRELRGRVVLLNFWSAACPPCREKMPVMQRLYEDLRQDGFVVLAVNVNDLPALAREFVAQNGYTFPVLKDDGLVGRLYEVRFIPKTFLLDSDGVIRQIRVGALGEQEMRQMVEEWL
ncbi:MAG: Thiol-disulfide oxidoreductase ResA [Syntrophomonadaceae bacterium]|nr:Thiol-disulfide oxidoreductase ResA [Bacillota bacterium]